MLALTLTEPWASLVAVGAKQIETRSWGTDFRGPIAIHAGKGFSGQDMDCLLRTPEITAALTLEHWLWPPSRPLIRDAFAHTRGKVVAITSVIGCVRTETVCFPSALNGNAHWVATSNAEAALGDFSSGRWAWILGDVYRLIEPVPATGTLGLWEWERPAGSATELMAFQWDKLGEVA